MQKEDSLGGARADGRAGFSPSVEGTFGASSSGSQLEYNPLNVTVGECLRLQDSGLTGLEVQVEQVLGTIIEHGGKRHLLADYVVIGDCTPETRPLADVDGKVRMRLRYVTDDQGNVDVTVFQAQHFQGSADLYFSSLAATVSDVSLRDARGGYEHGFERIGGAYDVYRGHRVVVSGEGVEGSISTHQIESLDYSREQRDAEGGTYTQWALVERNVETREMITLFGWSVDPYSIERVRK